MKKGIYLVANLKSQQICENLIYSIRESGCTLPIRLIHFGGEKVHSDYIKSQVELLYFNDFSNEAKQFIENLKLTLTECPVGFLYRFLPWFSDWDHFIYSDNDVVALCNWDLLFDYTNDYDFVHADEEYITHGIYNYHHPEAINKVFGESALESLLTAGHIVVKKNQEMINDINKAAEWMKSNTQVSKLHDQSLMHIASLIGNWKMLNLCKEPYNWLSSWSGSYKNSLQLIQTLQNKNSKISHIHYSGDTPNGNLAIQDLLFSINNDNKRLKRLLITGVRHISGFEYLKFQKAKIKRYIFSRFSL